MFDIDKWYEIYLTIKKHKLRTLLTAFGVFWGIFMLILLLGAGKGLENGVMRDFDIAKNTVFVWTRQTTVPYKGFQPGRSVQLRNSDIDLIRREVPEVEVIAPRLPVWGDFVVERKQKNASFQVMGDDPGFLKVKPVIIDAGRFLNRKDILDRRKVAIIGKRVREVLFEPTEDPIGEFITIKGVPFKVAGVFSSQVKGEQSIEDSQMIFIPFSTAQIAFNMPNRVGWFAFIPKEGVPAVVIEEKVKATLAARHSISPEDRGAFGSANIEQEFQEISNLFIGIRGFSWLVAIGTIISGMVGVGNIMMIIVKERTREIGIRKSLGAKPWSIISMILMESLTLTGVAGYVGLLLGVLAIEGVDYLLVNFEMEGEFFANPEVDFPAAISAIIVLLIAGAVAGLIPGMHAARINPVLALRDE